MKQVHFKVLVLTLAALFMACVCGQEIDAANGEPGGERLAPAKNPTSEKTSPPAESHSVIVNGKRLSARDIESLARKYNIRANDGEYWYDRRNGSWGRQGGPAEGFIMAGLKLGGPLKPDASNGDTGVFINGRQLHRVDVMRLMQIVPVYQGRYWMDAQGFMGLEGQPALINIWALAAQAQGGGRRKEGILSTYDKTGVAVFGY